MDSLAELKYPAPLRIYRARLYNKARYSGCAPMSSSLSKILEAGINVFKINYQIIKNKKIMKYQLNTNVSKNNRRLLVVISE